MSAPPSAPPCSGTAPNGFGSTRLPIFSLESKTLIVKINDITWMNLNEHEWTNNIIIIVKLTVK